MAQRQQNDEEGRKWPVAAMKVYRKKTLQNIPDDEIDELLRLIKTLSKTCGQSRQAL